MHYTGGGPHQLDRRECRGEEKFEELKSESSILKEEEHINENSKERDTNWHYIIRTEM